MGFVVKIDDNKGEITVTLDGNVVSLFPREGIKAGLEAQRVYFGADSIAAIPRRQLFDQKLLNQKLLRQEISHQEMTNPKFLEAALFDKEKESEESKSVNDKTQTAAGEDDTKKNEAQLPVTQGEGEPKVPQVADPLKDAHVDVVWQGYFNTTVENVMAQFELAQGVWPIYSPDFEMWDSRMKALKAANFPITNMVALGLGTHHGIWEPKLEEEKHIPHATCLQLALVMHIRKVLGEEGKLLPCVIQDITYSELDKEFLRTLEFTVVDDPDAFPLINDKSMVFHLGTFLKVAWWICAGTWPAAMITEDCWANPCKCLAGDGTPKYVVPGLRDMFDCYDVDKVFSERSFKDPGIVNIYSIDKAKASKAKCETGVIETEDERGLIEPEREMTEFKRAQWSSHPISHHHHAHHAHHSDHTSNADPADDEEQ